jgi:signal peptidase I
MFLPLAYFYLGQAYELVYIPTGSMAPNLPPGSLALVNLQAQPTVGDVALANIFGAKVLHRVTWINLTAWNFGFKGDAVNTTSIVNLSNVEGVVVAAVPLVGYLPMSINSYPIIWMMGSAAIVAIAAGFSLMARKKVTKA